jgi:hypothetical protein
VGKDFFDLQFPYMSKQTRTKKATLSSSLF